METNNEAALIETALQRSALDAAGLTGITTEHIARMVVAFGLQPYHLIEKGFIKPGLFHGVAWSHLSSPLSYAAPPTTAPPAEVAVAPEESTPIIAPPAYPETPAYAPPAYAPPAPVVAEEATPAPAATSSTSASAEEPTAPLPTTTSAPSAASAAEEAHAMMVQTLSAEREAEERLRAAQIEADERIARLLISGSAGHVADVPAAVGPTATPTAYPTLPGADRNVAAGRDADEKMATLNVMGLTPTFKATHRARQLLLEGRDFDTVVTMLSAFNTNRARKEARKAAKKAAKERKRQERAANLAALERCVPGCGCDASVAEYSHHDAEFWRHQR